MTTRTLRRRQAHTHRAARKYGSGRRKIRDEKTRKRDWKVGGVRKFAGIVTKNSLFSSYL